MTHDSPVRGFFGLLGIWLANIIGHLSEIQQGFQILATIAAIIASIFYARYYWLKTKKERRKR